MITLVITPDGYPVAWRVMPGNTQDVTTVTELAKKLKERFGIKERLLVFDLGMMSAENLHALSEQGFTYFSALDRDENKTLDLLESDFPEVLEDNWRENLNSAGLVFMIIFTSVNIVFSANVTLSPATGSFLRSKENQGEYAWLKRKNSSLP